MSDVLCGLKTTSQVGINIMLWTSLVCSFSAATLAYATSDVYVEYMPGVSDERESTDDSVMVSPATAVADLEQLNWSTARVSLRKYFIPGCVGKGLGLDLRIRPAAAPAPAASGPKLGPRGWAQAGPKWVGPGYTDLAPLGLRSKNEVFERPG